MPPVLAEIALKPTPVKQMPSSTMIRFRSNPMLRDSISTISTTALNIFLARRCTLQETYSSVQKLLAIDYNN
ncbi:hypothetical protein E2C01_072552 [Portunus trituberculatus]|uniref:Uncharacterized protein n=1 Tax=Portunus trituberculatus TaxID=210409 RepID=A0A5B7I992_PORTR|nr:hypothetical protein [Portunus trituberculatus]